MMDKLLLCESRDTSTWGVPSHTRQSLSKEKSTRCTQRECTISMRQWSQGLLPDASISWYICTSIRGATLAEHHCPRPSQPAHLCSPCRRSVHGHHAPATETAPLGLDSRRQTRANKNTNRASRVWHLWQICFLEVGRQPLAWHALSYSLT